LPSNTTHYAAIRHHIFRHAVAEEPRDAIDILYIGFRYFTQMLRRCGHINITACLTCFHAYFFALLLATLGIFAIRLRRFHFLYDEPTPLLLPAELRYYAKSRHIIYC